MNWDVIVGLAKMAEYWKANVKLDQKGDYVITATREPAIYDLSWIRDFEEPPPVCLIYEYSKTFIHVLKEGDWDKPIGLEAELIPLVNHMVYMLETHLEHSFYTMVYP